MKLSSYTRKGVPGTFNLVQIHTECEQNLQRISPNSDWFSLRSLGKGKRCQEMGRF